MAKAAKRTTTHHEPEEGRGRAKPLPREVVRTIAGQITVRDDESGDGMLVLTVRSQGRLVGRAYGHGKATLIEVAREHFGPGGVLKRSASAPGVWLVFK